MSEGDKRRRGLPRLGADRAVGLLCVVAFLVYSLRGPTTTKNPQVALRATAADKLKASESWQAGIRNEIDFHKGYMRGDPKHFDSANAWKVEERMKKLVGETVPIWNERFCPVLRENGVQLSLALDHGAGPLSQLGDWFSCPGLGSARVVAVDPLAPLYHRLKNELKDFRTGRTMYCPSEMLRECFDVETFDFVTIFNALDHSVDAIGAYKASVDVLRKGGISCVISIQNEASRENFEDFHQWNLDIDLASGVFKFEKPRESIWVDMDAALKGRARRVFAEKDETTFTACYQKTVEDVNPAYPKSDGDAAGNAVSLWPRRRDAASR